MPGQSCPSSHPRAIDKSGKMLDRRVSGGIILAVGKEFPTHFDTGLLAKRCLMFISHGPLAVAVDVPLVPAFLWEVPHAVRRERVMAVRRTRRGALALAAATLACGSSLASAQVIGADTYSTDT